MSFYTGQGCILFSESHDSLSEHVESVLKFFEDISESLDFNLKCLKSLLPLYSLIYLSIVTSSYFLNEGYDFVGNRGNIL